MLQLILSTAEVLLLWALEIEVEDCNAMILIHRVSKDLRWFRWCHEPLTPSSITPHKRHLVPNAKASVRRKTSSSWTAKSDQWICTHLSWACSEDLKLKTTMHHQPQRLCQKCHLTLIWIKLWPMGKTPSVKGIHQETKATLFIHRSVH
jgi:hypothetical protein